MLGAVTPSFKECAVGDVERNAGIVESVTRSGIGKEIALSDFRFQQLDFFDEVGIVPQERGVDAIVAQDQRVLNEEFARLARVDGREGTMRAGMRTRPWSVTFSVAMAEADCESQRGSE